MPKIPSRPALDLSGKWVVELPSLPEDYLARPPDPQVLIRHEDFYRFTATYQFGAQQGEIDGRVDEVWPNAAQLFLTFAGTERGARGLRRGRGRRLQRPGGRRHHRHVPLPSRRRPGLRLEARQANEICPKMNPPLELRPWRGNGPT